MNGVRSPPLVRMCRRSAHRMGWALVLGPAANGNLSLFPAGAPVPTTASVTFVAGNFLANWVNVAIQNQSTNTPLVLDAVAYVS